MNKPIILFCGLLGTGKSTISKYLIEKIKHYTRFNPDDTRRILGKKVFDEKDTPEVIEYMYSRAKKILEEGKGVLFDSSYYSLKNRDKIYQIGRDFNVPVLVVECFCDDKTALERISSRPPRDDLWRSTNDPQVYYEYIKKWEPPERDLNLLENQHVSFAKLNTEGNILKGVRIREEDVGVLREILTDIGKHLKNFKVS